MKRDFASLASGEFDLLIAGGGIYGAWTAYDAACRGLRVAIVEQGDWASATSSASSKLIHGGLRYLEQGDFKLVRKALAERERLLRIAPHRVWSLNFGVPIYAGSRFKSWQLRIGLTAYDFLADTLFSNSSHRRFNNRKFAQRFPALNADTLQCGFVYADAQTDDARLVLELIAGAMEQGAVCVNYCQMTELVELQGRACGAIVRDQSNPDYSVERNTPSPIEGEGGDGGESVADTSFPTPTPAGVVGDLSPYNHGVPLAGITLPLHGGGDNSAGLKLATAKISAKQIVNTTGQWQTTAPQTQALCRLTKGVHLVMPNVMAEEALLLTAPSDGRVFFMIPWYGMTLLGTTDTEYKGDINHVSVEPEDVRYLLAAANHYLKTPWTEADVIGSYAGVRTMKRSDAASPSAVSRDWELVTTENGVHHSIGGKITSAREDAARIVDKVCVALAIPTPCATQDRHFPWAPGGSYADWYVDITAQALALGVDDESTKWLIRRHGKHVTAILQSIERDATLAKRIVPTVPLIVADLVYCARTEMVVLLDDLLRRRLPLLILTKLDESALRRIAGAVARTMDWDEAAVEAEIKGCTHFTHD